MISPLLRQHTHMWIITTLFAITNDAKDSILQEAINKVASWSSENDMRLNATKTKEMLISFYFQLQVL